MSGCFGALSTQNTSGTTQGAALVQLVACGAADVNLTANATVTFWRTKVNKCTNFAMETIQQNFNSSAQFNTEVQLTVNRTGDLIYWMYALVDLPAIAAVPVEPGRPCCGFPCSNPCDPCEDGEEECGPCDLNRSGSRVLGGVFEQSGISRASSYNGGSGSGSGSSSSFSSSSGSGNGRGGDGSSSSGSGSSSFSSSDSINSEPDRCTGLRRPYCHWVNEIGHVVIERSTISIGGQCIDTLYNHFLHMWEELAGQPGKRLEEMIGKRNTTAALVNDSHYNRRLYVPLPFWFTRDPGLALCIVSLQFHSIQISLKIAPLEKLIQVSDCNTSVVKCCDGTTITRQDINLTLDTEYVYLDMEERDRFATGCFQQLIQQVQQYSTSSSQGSAITAQLNFNHPCIEVIWAFQRQCQAKRNNWFNYSGAFGRDPVTRCQLRLNNLCRFDRESTYFRLVQPYQHHTCIPKNFVYCYSFALCPELSQPSGSLNFSRIDSIEFQACVQPAISKECIALYMFARTWNVIRFRDGLGGLLYSSNAIFAAPNVEVTWV